MNLFKRLKSFQYHKEQIEILLRAKSGVVVINLVAPIMFFMGYQDIPANLLYFLTFPHLIILALRIGIGDNFLKKLPQLQEKEIQKHLKIYLSLVLLSNILWSIAAVSTVIYTDILHIFIFMTILVTIISGAMATIGSIYHAIFIYIVTVVPSLAFSLVYLSNDIAYYITSLALFVYMFIMLQASFRSYNLLENTISQKKEIELLNSSLEEKVKQAIKETEKKEQMLQQQSHLAQMGEMISMIAHQWRQPLAAISSTVVDLQIKEELDKSYSQPEYLKKSLADITKYVQFLSTTIDDFRDFFKPDKEKEYVTLTHTINKSLQILQGSIASKSIEVDVDFATNDEIFIYQNEMMQVILNILKNSVDNFLEKSIKDPKIEICTKKNQNTYIIQISDNGGGIPDEIMPNIFNPYFSTKKEKNGTGLGLYMSKTIVEKHHGGKLRVYNSNDGVTFKIVLYSEEDGQRCALDEF